MKKVSSVTKTNAQQYGMVLWDDVFERVARDYPDVETESVLVDAMSAKFVLHPEDLSVVVASNLQRGHPLRPRHAPSPAASAWPPAPTSTRSGASPACSNRSTARRRTSPGRASANPIGAIASAALMLDHLGLPEQAARLDSAIEPTTAAGILTRDLGGTASTDDVTKALIDALNP